MKQVVVEAFGGPEQLKVQEVATPEPGPGQVLVRLTSIGLNHAELMARRGEYKLASGEPPFTPGLEGGGVIEAAGVGVEPARIGQRVTLSPDAPRLVVDHRGGRGGTYRSHYVLPADRALPVPDAVPDDQLGALWLSYLTAWGCLVWKQQLQSSQVVAMPAASSSVALAAAQIVRQQGGTAVGLTSHPQKVHVLKELETSAYDHVILTHDPDRAMKPWHRELKELTGGRGVDVFFDPVAAGEYLSLEIRGLAQHGCVWIYGLLGEPDKVDVTPLIRKYGAIRGWMLGELIEAGETVWREACQQVLKGFAAGTFRQHIGGRFKLDEVRHAHEQMEKGEHIGKFVLVP